MGKSLRDIAQDLKDANKKVQLIYAFNGTGKTRLSREFRYLIDSKLENDLEIEESFKTENKKILYYNAFTEDLFYWDNDLELGEERTLKIQPNSFIEWIFEDQGQDQNIIGNFQRYTNQFLTPKFNSKYSAVTFSIQRGDNENFSNIKISKGEESNFIWSIFYSLLVQVISVLNEPDLDERETNRFDQLEYIFIDDPVSSLDDNHLIQLAVDLAEVIKLSKSDLKFIITTHSPVFYNVIYNELKTKACYLLNQYEDGTFELNQVKGDSNKSFSYHLHLKNIIEEAIKNNKIEKYHFTLLRNLYEKTSSFLGFPKWSELLPDDKGLYYNRVMQFTSHSTLSELVVREPTEPEKQTVKFLLNHLTTNYNFWREMND
jgi:hypothetical protein